MKLLYVSYYDTDNIREWSGIPYHMLRAARNVFEEVEIIPPKKVPFRLWNRLKFRFFRDVLKKGYVRETQKSFLKDYATAVEKDLLFRSGDLVFADSLFQVAYLECDRPIVIWGDATMKALREHYFKQGNEWTKFASDRVQRKTIQRVDLNIYASHWAMKSAIKDYGLNPDKAMVIPFGANMTHAPERALIERIIQKKQITPCRLLLIGVDWERKGADLAVEVAEKLHHANIPVELTIMGCWPKNPAKLPPYVKLMGFVNKQDPHEMEKFIQILAHSSFLLFPSRAEAFGIVACEAAAYGIPTLSSDVGGITSAVREGKNGFHFPLETYVENVVEKVKWYIDHPLEYFRIATSSRDEYEQELNWEVGFRKIRKFFEKNKK